MRPSGARCVRRALLMVLCAGLCLPGCRRGGPATNNTALPEVASEAPSANGETGSVAVYFPIKSLKYLEAEAVDLPERTADPQKLATYAVQALLNGPVEEAHVAILPKGVLLNKLNVGGKLVTVDLSGSFAGGFKGGSNVAALAVWSLVNTVTAIDGLKQVRIMLDGKPATTFGGVLDLSKPLEADPKLLGGEKLGP